MIKVIGFLVSGIAVLRCKMHYLPIIILLVSFSQTGFSQQIMGKKGVVHKQGTFNIEMLKNHPFSISNNIKRPNPNWQPRQWSFSDNIIFEQKKQTIAKNHYQKHLVSPAPDTTFAGLMDNGNAIPPDVNGAAGPNHLMQTLNTDVRISDKLGNELFTTSLDSWWAELPGSSTFDPKIVFDPYQNRWIMITPSGNNSTNSRMYLGVSTTDNPLDDWNFYWFDTDPEGSLWFDYPNLGFNKKWISIGGIMRNSAFEAVEFVVFAIDKMAAYNGEEEISQSRFTTTIGSAIVPAFTYDSLSEELYLISTGNGNYEGNGYVNLFELSGEILDPFFELKGSISVPYPWENWSYENHGDFLPQMGSSEKINSVDARMHTMIFRNDKLWAVHHIYLPANEPEYCAIQWWNLDTTGAILELGRIESPEASFAFPSIAVNMNEDMIIGHGVFSENHYAGAGYSYKDHLDDSATMRDYLIYKEGLAPYYKTFGGDRNRWGDYSAVFVDPVDDLDFWAMHEFADTPMGSDKWGTWWAFLKPSFSPWADFEADEVLIPVGESVNFTDLTLGVPSGWEWTFEEGNPPASSEQNPQDIVFDQQGTFDVTLIATNSLGSDTIIKEDFIETSTSILPEIDFTADKTVVCTGNTVVFTDKTKFSPNQWEWQFDPSSVSFVNGTDQFSQNPEVVFEEAQSYSVTLTAWNLNGSSQLTKFEMLAAGGYIPYYKETFEEDTFKSDEWTIENPDESVTWEVYETGGTLPGNRSMGVDFSEYLIGKRDRLISPPFNLQGLNGAWLEFYHAYAKKYDPLTDSLIIYVSDDCGLNWEVAYADGEDGSGNFATQPQTNDFWPQTSSDWCGNGWGASCISVDLSSWAGQANVQLAFETYSAIGNPLFIDNITISQYLGMENVTKEVQELLVYPNPAGDRFTVVLPESGEFRNLEIKNSLGQFVLRKTLSAKDKFIEIQVPQSWSKGLYFLQIEGADKVLTTKVILE